MPDAFLGGDRAGNGSYFAFFRGLKIDNKNFKRQFSHRSARKSKVKRLIYDILAGSFDPTTLFVCITIEQLN